MESIYQGREKFTRYLMNTRPKTELYKTVSHRRPFSSDYILKVPSNFCDRSYASVVGSAFDYLARFLIARKSKLYKMQVTFNLKAFEGIEYFDKSLREKYYERYKEEITKVVHFINYIPDVGLSDVILASCFFARLEHNARTSWIPNAKQIKFIEAESAEIIKDLMSLSIVFESEFLRRIVRENSIIYYNPKFGDCSKFLSGADADIYIDGVLYDFKTSKSFLAKKEDETQLWQYFVFDKASKLDSDTTSTLYNKEIKALAIYRARYGEIEYLKVDTIKEGLIYAVSRNITKTLENVKTGMSIDEEFMHNKKKVNFDEKKLKIEE